MGSSVNASRRRSLFGGITAAVVIGGAAFWMYLGNWNTPQSALALFDEVALPTGSDRVMIVSPHQDDETLGAGSYVMDAVRAGAAVEVVYATDGNKHGLKDVRRAEALKVMGILGVQVDNVVFFDFPDGDLSVQKGFLPRLQVEIGRFKPTIVITAMPEDLHPDHAACGATVAQINQIAKSFKAMYFLIHYQHYPRLTETAHDLYLLPPLQLLTGKYNWHVLPVSQADQSTKLTAIETYKSQLRVGYPILHQPLASFARRNEVFATLDSGS
jgi:LmbE family N-acetylglucosaminyl deacetylase